uniref:ATP synthase subunit a n=1 Tax=Porichthys myriaster TaxID=262771 RepID=Q5GM89_9TELE|nr:ATPase subunit 6 [Porichthys myriaster]
MTMNLFGQFESPTTLGIPLMVVAIILPVLLLKFNSSRWSKNRMASVQAFWTKQFTSQLMQPINKPGHKWALLLTSLFLFIITTNTLGLLPYTFTPTTQLSMNLGLAIPLWLATVITGFRNDSTHALGHLLPESTPTLLIPILVVIETASLFIRPLALGVRLTANLTAGHLLIQLIATTITKLLIMSISAALITMALLVLLTILEIAVAMIQAYVFVLLLSLYLQENV